MALHGNTYTTSWRLCLSTACTDSAGIPRAHGEVWKASKDGCCMYSCNNDTIVPVEYNCSSVATPMCRRAGEMIISLADDASCCPRKVCGGSEDDKRVNLKENLSGLTVSCLPVQCVTRVCVTSCLLCVNMERNWCHTTGRTPAVQTTCAVSVLDLLPKDSLPGKSTGAATKTVLK